MKTAEIEELLSRFYEGKTTLEEEKFLREYFSGKHVPESMSEHSEYFRWASTMSKESSNNPFPGDNFNRESVKITCEINLTASRFRKRRSLIISVAASLVILMGISFIFKIYQKEGTSTARQKTELAYAYNQSVSALFILSGNFNYGLSQATKLHHFEEATSQLESFNMFFQSQNEIFNTANIYH